MFFQRGKSLVTLSAQKGLKRDKTNPFKSAGSIKRCKKPKKPRKALKVPERKIDFLCQPTRTDQKRTDESNYALKRSRGHAHHYRWHQKAPKGAQWRISGINIPTTVQHKFRSRAFFGVSKEKMKSTTSDK